MKGKPDLVKASRISAVAKKVGSVYVVATRDQQLPQEENASAQIAAQYPLAEYSCKECATVFHANQGLTAHCVTCGSLHVECSNEQATASAGKKGKATIHADAELVHIACEACATSNILHAEVAGAAGDAIHCIACGHRNVIQASLDGQLVDDLDGDSFDDLDLVDTSEDADVGVGDEPFPAATPPAAMPPADTGVDGTPSPTNEATNVDEVVPPTNNEPTTTLSPVVDPAPADPVVDETSPAVVYSEEDEMDVNLLDTEGDTPFDELSLVWVRDNLALANSKFQLIATLSEKDAGDNADIMQTREFAQAVGHMIKDKGIVAACNHYGFKPVTVSLPIKKVVNAQVEQALAEKAKELNDKIEAVAADFGQSAEIAATGVVKNFWKDVQDPLKAAMAQELSAVGVKNPTKLLDKVWASYASKLLRTILDKAKELSTKTVEARNELVETLDMVNHVPTRLTAEADDEAEQEDEDDEDGDDTVESRLSMAAVPVNTLTASTGRTGSGRSTIQAILAGRQGHFNS